MFPFFISSNSLFIYPLFSHNVTRFLFFVYLLIPTTVSVSVYVCVNLFCVYFCSDLLSLSLFALSCSLMFSIALSLARPPAQNLSPFSLPSLSVLFSFSHSLALTHTYRTSRSLFVFSSLFLSFRDFRSSFCFVMQFFYFVTATLSRALLFLFSFLFFFFLSCFPPSPSCFCIVFLLRSLSLLSF